MPKESKYLQRCAWAAEVQPFYQKYHDEKWGVPVHDDLTHFEFLILEGAQAGLSWSTVLKKREGYRKAFHGFNVKRVAKMSDQELEEIIRHGDVIRNRLKIYSARKNALVFLNIQKEFGSFSTYIWSFVGGKQKVNHWKSMKQLPATSPESDKLSKDLKKRGMTFVGSTIMYAHLQATGLINDHQIDCFRYKKVSKNK